MESSRPLRAASPPDEAPTAVHETEAIHPVTEPESLAPALASSEQCANCGSQLAPDQNYCLVCGERRGPARFSAVPTSGAVTTTITETRVAGRPPRFGSAATTLIAGVATLLIAMGIGVYIGGLGKSNNSSSGQPVRVLTVGGGGSAASTGSTPATAATGGGSSAGGSKHKKSGAAKKSGTAAKVVTTVKNQPPPTVTIGASGSGKGFQKGKFTGHFFGP